MTGYQYFKYAVGLRVGTDVPQRAAPLTVGVRSLFLVAALLAALQDGWYAWIGLALGIVIILWVMHITVRVTLFHMAETDWVPQSVPRFIGLIFANLVEIVVAAAILVAATESIQSVPSFEPRIETLGDALTSAAATFGSSGFIAVTGWAQVASLTGLILLLFMTVVVVASAVGSAQAARAQGATGQNKERFFYHSFPRHSDSDDVASKGRAIIESMVGSGFLLTPEVTSWSERQPSGGLSEPASLIQKSISFTELESSELSRHAARYGPFSFEFPTRAIVELGALPVVYLPPLRFPSEGLDGIGPYLLMRLGEIQGLLELLVQVSDLDDDDTELTIERNGQPIGSASTSIVDAQDFIRLLESHRRPIRELVTALRAFLGLVYRTTDVEDVDDELKHYREREWRIVGGLNRNGAAIHRNLSDDQKDTILRIDPSFFGEPVRYRTGTTRRVDQCWVFTDLDGRHVLSYASRCIVPTDAVAETERVLRNAGLAIDVISLEDL